MINYIYIKGSTLKFRIRQIVSHAMVAVASQKVLSEKTTCRIYKFHRGFVFFIRMNGLRPSMFDFINFH